MLVTVLITLTILLVSLYVLLVLRAAIWVRSVDPEARNTNESLRIAIVVAARDEETDLPDCLKALVAQNYPAEFLDIYVADDHSSDKTAEIIREYENRASDGNGIQVHYVGVPSATEDLKGKAHAIHTAIQTCDHDYILITDADCRPHPDWVATHATAASDPSVGMICGHAYVRGTSFFASLQALDWTYLLSAASMLVETGRPLTAMGNNMGVKRAAYEAVGGYPSLPFSVTEDYVLFQSVAKQTDFAVRYPIDPALSVVTLPEDGLRAMYNQRRRWARGGLSAPLWIRGLYVITFLVHLLPLMIATISWPVATVTFAGKTIADLSLLVAALSNGNRRSHLKAFVAFEAYLHFYAISLPFTLLFAPRITWKGRSH